MKIAGVLASKGDFVATITGSSTVNELLTTLAAHQIGAVVVVDDDSTICGMISERDVVRALNRFGPAMLDAPVSALMTPFVAVCSPSTTLEEVALAMTTERVRHVPVIGDDGVLAGIVSIGDVVKARIDELEFERQRLMDYITS